MLPLALNLHLLHLHISSMGLMHPNKTERGLS